MNYLADLYKYLLEIHTLLPGVVGLIFLYGVAAIYFLEVGPFYHLVNKTPQEFGANGKNGPFDVWMCRHINTSQSWIGVLAQELFEFQYKWRTFHMPRFSKNALREMEIRGHTVECVAATLLDGKDPIQYETLEAQSMIQGYGDLFKHYTVGMIRAEFSKHRNDAVEWVEEHRSWLMKKARERG